jgi:hypothetical protein
MAVTLRAGTTLTLVRRTRASRRNHPAAVLTTVVGLLAATLTACAEPGAQPGGTPTARTSVVVVTSAAGGGTGVIAPVPAGPEEVVGDVVGCGVNAVLQPPSTPDPTPAVTNEVMERARRALEHGRSAAPIPRRGAVPAAGVAGAEECVQMLNLTFTLLTYGSTKVPSATEVRQALDDVGLTRVVVRARTAGPAFAGWSGKACVFGEFRGATPILGIAAPTDDGTCLP